MKLNLFLLLCLTGFLPGSVSILRTVPHRYELIMTPATWSDAQNYCRLKYNDLATTLSDTDWLRLNKTAARNGLTTSAWVGLSINKDNWRWSLNNLPLTTDTYVNWYPGFPDNIAGSTCGTVSIAGYWLNPPCTTKRPFICYSANFTDANKFIGISNPNLTWPEAQTYCQTHYTDLASALDSTDNGILTQLKYLQGDSWIGLNKVIEPWKWSDGTNASNIPWYSGQPDNFYGNENCATVYNEYFYDEPCTNLHYFFCQTISPMRGQIMRLQVKSDGSMFDPAVQSSILEQIKQELKNNGMLDNTTVTWRVQKDGNIFQKDKTGSSVTNLVNLNPLKCNL